MTREERAAKNEGMFREVNERIKEVTLAQRGEWLTVLCECSNPNCVVTIDISLDEYEATRANAARFALAPGHEDTAVERVVQRRERFLVVQKTGSAGDVARSLDANS